MKPNRCYAKGGLISASVRPPKMGGAKIAAAPKPAAQPRINAKGDLGVSAEPFLAPVVNTTPKRKKVI